MQKWLYPTLLALTAATPTKQATINTNVMANSAEAPKPIDQPCNGQPKHDRASALCAQWIAADAGNRSATASEQSAFYALLATIFSAAGIVGLIVTLQLTIRANRHASKTATRELRAYVSVQPLDLSFFHGDKGMSVEIKMHNGGATPAYECVHGGNIVALRPDNAAAKIRPNNFGQEIGEPAPLVLHAGQEMIGSIVGSFPLKEDEALKITTGELAIYAFGFVRYTDTFGNKRQSSFCYRIMDPGELFETKSIERKAYSARLWRLEAFHNEAT